MKIHRITGGGGVQLHVVETGNPQGRPIVFIHGASQCWLQWSRQMNSSLVEDHRLIALDMRGHGLSDKPHDGYNDSKPMRSSRDSILMIQCSPAGRMVRLCSSTTFATTAKTALVAFTSSVRSRSSAVKRPCRSSLLSFSAWSHSSSPPIQIRVSAVSKACYGRVLALLR